MNIVVCVKQVPDTQSNIQVDRESGFVDTRYLPYITNPCDLAAVEWAASQKEGNKPVKVTVVSMGPHSAKKALRECIAIGADSALLLSDPAFEKSDGYATGMILAKAIGLLKYDIIMCGIQAMDTNAGWVGPVIANRLGVPLVSRVTDVEVHCEREKITVQRRLEGGSREIVETSIPCLLTVESRLSKPRYPSFRSIIAAKKANIEQYDMKSLDLRFEEVGSSGSITHITRLSISKPKPKKVFTPDSSLPAANRIQLVISGGITGKKANLFDGNPKELVLKLAQFLGKEKILHCKKDR